LVDKTLLIYLAKIDSSGKVQWEQTFGSGIQNAGTSVRQTTDGNYIIAGTTIQSLDQAYVYLAKTDSSGKVQWEQNFGGKGVSVGMSVQQTKDSGYIVGGVTNSSGAGKQDFYLVKTDSSGTKQWQQTFGGKGDDLAFAVRQTYDGGYILVGGSDSFTTDNRTQAYLVKSDSSGSMQWQETLGVSGNSTGADVQQTTDGGYIVVGLTDSGHANRSDVYLAKL